jgi:hypothetical protein
VVQPNPETSHEDAGQPVARLTRAQLDSRAQWFGRRASASASAGKRTETAIRDARYDLASVYLCRANGIAFWLHR